MEITLDDLMVLEPRLSWGPVARNRSEKAADRCCVVSWVVSARSTAPHLPQLRGGEVVLIPQRVIAVIGGDLPALMKEAKLREVAAVVFERGGSGVSGFESIDTVNVLKWDEDFATDTETGINRLLTECRSNLYRVGSELERKMTDLTASRSGLKNLVQTTSDLSGLPAQVIDPHGRLLAASHQEYLHSDPASRGTDETQVEKALPSGLLLILGPLRPEQRVVGRFLVDRIGAAVTIAARQDEAVRPRGTRRVEALEALLAGKSGNASAQRAAALTLGLDPDSMFLVVVSSIENDEVVTNALAPLGTLHPAGEENGRRTMLIAVSGRAGSDILGSRVAEAKRRWLADTIWTTATLAISAPASGVDRLSAAAREAGLISRLQTESRLTHRAASFDSIDDVGAFQLLFPLRDTSGLHTFVAEVLGSLERRDQRGTLRETLRAYLETGGSHAEASNRLGIHRNTLSYRLRRISELIGRDASNPKLWLTLHLALWASELLRVDSDES